MSKSTMQILKQNHQKILQLWEDRAAKEIASNLGLSSLALRNSMSTFLDLIEEQLDPQKLSQAGERVTADQKDDFAKLHGIARSKTANYSIDQLIYEFHIFREVLFEVLEQESPLAKRERDQILNVVEEAVNISATHFASNLRIIRERLVSALTHDLKTPVASVLLSAQLLLRKPGDEKFCRTIATNIINSVNRLDKMISDILDASRLGAGETLDLKFESMDIDLLLKEVVANCELLYGNRFVYKSSGPVEGIWNSEGLRRIFENLTNNAVKYSTPASPITLSLENRGKQIEVRIHNYGAPISAEQKEILFQQFRRLKSAQDQKGWGLGLLLTKGLVEAHSGTVILESSSKDKGTLFLVTLPRTPVGQTTLTSVASSGSSPLMVGSVAQKRA